MSAVAAACDPPLLRLPPPPTGEPPLLFELYAAPAPPPLERPVLELKGEWLSASSPRPSVSS